MKPWGSPAVVKKRPRQNPIGPDECGTFAEENKTFTIRQPDGIRTMTILGADFRAKLGRGPRRYPARPSKFFQSYPVQSTTNVY